MRIFVTGTGGLLGSAVASEAADRRWPVVPSGRADLDVTDAVACREVIGRARPDAVVHCAAYTQVDRAEDEERLAFEVNAGGAGNVASCAAEVGAPMVYPSTDYVFDGRAFRPYDEDATPAPLGAYGRTKWAGEQEVRRLGGNHLIVRTSWLYGAGGRNFVDTIRRLASDREEIRVVADQRGRPTWARSLARAILDLLEAGARGTLHACDSGTASWLELAQAVLRQLGLERRLVPVTTDEWKAPAPRPSYSVLALDRAEAVLGRPFPHWRDSLASYLGEDR